MQRLRDDDSDVVLAAALALIDDVYGSSGSGDFSAECAKLRRRRFSRQQEETVLLRVQVQELQQCLDTLRGRCTLDRPSVLADEWHHIASRQGQQREQTVVTNALLRDAMQQQCALASRVCVLLANAQATLQSIEPITKRVQSLPLNYRVPPELMRQLDSVRHELVSRPNCDVSESKHTMKWQISMDKAECEYRLTALYPFKVSTIANELWKALHENSRGEVHGRLDQDEAVHTSHVILCKPFGRMEVDGSTAMQRTYLPDGSVLLACAAISTGPATTDNIMAGFQMHETVSMRVGRRDATNPRSHVVVEIVNRMTIQQIKSLGPSTTTRAADMTARLYGLQEFAQRCSDEDGARMRQELENRMLSSSANVCTRSVMPEQ